MTTYTANTTWKAMARDDGTVALETWNGETRLTDMSLNPDSAEALGRALVEKATTARLFTK